MSRQTKIESRRLFLAVTTTLTLLLSGPMALAQAQLDGVHCLPTPELHIALEQRFGVARQGTGLRSPDQMMELWSGEGGDWALVARYASGTSCILAMGAHWAEVQPRG